MEHPPSPGRTPEVDYLSGQQILGVAAEHPPRRGFKTSEGLLTLCSMLVGLLLMALGILGTEDPDARGRLMDIGALLLGAPAGLYALSRGIAKRGAGFMLLPLAALTAAAALSACVCPEQKADPDYVRRGSVAPLLEIVLQRHDQLIEDAVAAGQLDEIRATTWLRSSTMLLHVFNETDPTAGIALPNPPLPD